MCFTLIYINYCEKAYLSDVVSENCSLSINDQSINERLESNEKKCLILILIINIMFIKTIEKS